MAKKAVKKTARKATKKRARKAGQRELLKTPSTTSYAKRNPQGEFAELDDVGKSLTADRRRRAKRTVAPGYGDQGDQPVRKRAAKKTAKKR